MFEVQKPRIILVQSAVKEPPETRALNGMFLRYQWTIQKSGFFTSKETFDINISFFSSSPSIASNTDSFDRIQSGLQQLVLLAHEPRLESLMIDEETQVIEEKRPTRDNGTTTPQVGTRDFGQDMRIGVEVCYLK